ncbi:Chitin synthase [Actinidia chinensis var. chinensis]|uniref:Chitin synthase n=1 Tax=Actinidia chinensis var. chinensis TaxID=1590841 RepID=A0A2R6RPB9_ACTCC|nr:Chitin synthase [Actinidia chinensis var. chinensis]
MESSSSLDYLNLFLLRPILAISFVLSLILLGWFLAWKLVLVHVPLVREIFGLRKKPTKPKPPNRWRFSRFYNSIDAEISNSQCYRGVVFLDASAQQAGPCQPPCSNLD